MARAGFQRLYRDLTNLGLMRNLFQLLNPSNVECFQASLPSIRDETRHSRTQYRACFSTSTYLRIAVLCEFRKRAPWVSSRTWFHQISQLSTLDLCTFVALALVRCKSSTKSYCPALLIFVNKSRRKIFCTTLNFKTERLR